MNQQGGHRQSVGCEEEMASDLIQLEVEGAIAWVTLNRPKALNALSPELLRRLLAAIEMLGEDDGVEAIVLMGAGGKAFSSGADINVLNAASPKEVREYAQLAIAITRKLETVGKISIAAIDGIAAGGGLEIAEACMIRIATRGSRLGHPEVHIAAVAGWGGTTRLPRLVGRGRAAELLLTGEMIDAEKALEYGVVSRVVEKDCLRAEVRRMVARIPTHHRAAIALTWEGLHRGADLPLDAATALGADCFALAASMEDFKSGTRAFLEKKHRREAK